MVAIRKTCVSTDIEFALMLLGTDRLVSRTVDNIRMWQFPERLLRVVYEVLDSATVKPRDVAVDVTDVA